MTNTYTDTDKPLSALYDTTAEGDTTPAEPIPDYVPTQWTDDAEPDIDAEHLNHIEDGIKKVTDGLNNVIENGGGNGGGGGITPSDGYVFVELEESEDNPAPEEEPKLDADTLCGHAPSFFVPQTQISDAFDPGKDYAIGDYCIYLNALYRFIETKPAGAWDGTKVIPVSVSAELAALNSKQPQIEYFHFYPSQSNKTLDEDFSQQMNNFPVGKPICGYYQRSGIYLFYGYAYPDRHYAMFLVLSVSGGLYVVKNWNDGWSTTSVN